MKKILIFSFFLLLQKTLFSQVTLQNSNLPIVIITTQDAISDEPKVTGKMGIIDNGNGKRNNVTDDFNIYNGSIGIELRGQTSQQLSPKKPYSIELRDNQGNNNPKSLLGMPSESSWSLIAPYSDKSLIRDALAYELASLLMPYAPRTRFCELVLNGNYMGVYVLTEKIKQDKNRVNIDKMSIKDISGDELTGGYIFKWDKKKPNDVVFYSDYYAGKRLHEFILEYPKKENLAPEQLAYITNFVKKFEKTLYQEDFKSKKKQYTEYIDVQSFIDFSIINEISFNVDGQRLSTYFYKDKNSIDQRIKAGPVWDFNIAFGNANYCGHDKYEGWTKDFNLRCSDDFWVQPFWWDHFWKDHQFTSDMAKRWENLRKDTLSDSKINARIDALAAQLNEAQTRNFQQWKILDKWIWPNAKVNNSWKGEVDYLKVWLGNRTWWLDKNMKELLRPRFIYEDYFDIKVYPNPAQDFVNFDFYLAENSKVRVEIYDILGRWVTTLNTTAIENGESQIRWQNPTSKGVFLYRTYKNSQLFKTGKFVIR